MDDIDRAQAREEEFLSDALKAQLGKTAGPGAISLTHCLNCEEEIPQRRRELVPGCTLCIDCQNEKEINIRRAL